MARDLILPLLQDWRDAVAAALSPTPGRVFVNPGLEVPWDECCDGGQSWSRVISVTPRLTSPVTSRGTLCLTGMVLTAGIGVLRCAAVSDDQGNPPTAAEMDADAAQMTADAAALQAVLLCHIEPTSIEGGVPLGAEGGCVGWEWTFTKVIDVCGCDDEDEDDQDPEVV